MKIYQSRDIRTGMWCFIFSSAQRPPMRDAKMVQRKGVKAVGIAGQRLRGMHMSKDDQHTVNNELGTHSGGDLEMWIRLGPATCNQARQVSVGIVFASRMVVLAGRRRVQVRCNKFFARGS